MLGQEQVEAAVHRLVDRTEICELIARYGRCADQLDAEGMAACFTEDCAVGYVAGRGRHALADFLRTVLPGTRSSAHYLTNAELRFESSDAVLARFAMLSWKRLHGHPAAADPLRWGHYECRAVRTAAGWRFAQMDLITAGESAGTHIGEHRDRSWPPRCV